MKIAIFGGTGATGQELIKQALERNYHITAMVRNPAGILQHASANSANMEIITGDVLNVQQVAQAIDGKNAVISTLGFKRGSSTVTIYSDSAHVLIAAMQITGVRRLIYCTSAGVEDHDPNEFWFYRYIFKPLFLKTGYKDMQVAESLICTTNLDWVLVRPGLLTNGVRRGRYRVSPLYRPKRGINISRADLAHFMLDQITGNDWLQKTPTLSY